MFTNSRKLTVLLIFHIVWGVALWLSISKYGLGVSTDSTSYLFSGANWAEGNGLVDYSGAAYIYWPPLYPMLIGFLHAAGLSAFASAHVIQFAAYALLSYFSSIFFLKLFKTDFLFAFIGSFLLVTGSIVIPSFQMVGTDYLFSIFPIIFSLLIHEYAEKQKWTTLTLIGLTVSVAMLTRYLGYALVLSALLAVCCYSTGSTLKRILSTAYVGMFSLVPFLWMLGTWQATTGARRAPLTFEEYASQFTVGMIAWFTTDVPNPNKLIPFDYVSVWGWVLLGIILFLLLARKLKLFNSLTLPTLGFGMIYMIALFSNALIAYFNRLWGRFQLPIYFPLIVLFLSVIGLGLRALRESRSKAYYPASAISFLFIAVFGLMQFNITIGLMQNSYIGNIPENSINTADINENSILHYWKENTPEGEYRIFGNITALVAFHTAHEVDASPRRSGVYDENIVPIEAYDDTLFSSDDDAYLIWIEPNPYEHIYLPREFSPVAQLETIIENEDGGIYLLRRLR